MLDRIPKRSSLRNWLLLVVVSVALALLGGCRSSSSKHVEDTAGETDTQVTVDLSSDSGVDLTVPDTVLQDLEQPDLALSDGELPDVVADTALPDTNVEPDVPNTDVAIIPCSPQSGDPNIFLLKGTVVTPDIVFTNGEVLFSKSTGRIICAGESCSGQSEAANATVICTDGLIYPGLIDSHQHLHYNAIGPWQHTGQLFQNRYQWRGNSGYKNYVALVGSKLNAVNTNVDYQCRIQKLAEVRLVMSGTTSVQGSLSKACIAGLVRNVEDYGQVPNISGLDTKIYKADATNPITDYGKTGNLADFDKLVQDINVVNGLIPNKQGYVTHVGEGIDQSSLDELMWMIQHGWTATSGSDAGKLFTLMTPRTSIVHGTAANFDVFLAMQANNTKLIWSPQSNIDLYGQTTRVTMAKNMGLTIALAPDWTLSGTINMFTELKCADTLNAQHYGGFFSDKELVEMTTSNAAKALFVEDQIGYLKPGFRADITVVEGDRYQPYRALIGARAKLVKLVFINGVPVYGDASLMDPIKGEFCEPWDVCGASKTICLKTTNSAPSGKLGTGQNETVAELMASMGADLKSAGGELYGIFDCRPAEQTYSCKPHGTNFTGDITPTDSDGDGVPDDKDNCPTIFNPSQSNKDGDSLGDDCDPCPGDADTTICSTSTSGDTDGDGVPDDQDNCKFIKNPGQDDADGDGIGDACDECPQFSNLGGLPCPATVYTIPQVRNPQDPKYPGSGKTVLIKGVIVTGFNENGYYVQDPTEWRYGGLYVFTDGSNGNVQQGNLIDVQGTLSSYNGLAELANPFVTNPNPSDTSHTVTPLKVTIAGSTFAVGSETVVLEVLESVLLRFEGVSISAVSGKKFTLESVLAVSDFAFSYPFTPTVGMTFNFIQGVLDQYTNYQLLPRSTDDYEIKP
ncbi:MAG: amidohydrolase family protein [Myxococcales bacterium]|nr:amidohydrolase family protein [Myxococcales bacterium]